MTGWRLLFDCAVDPLVFLGGALLLVRLLGWWIGPLDRRASASYTVLTLLLFAVPLATPYSQLPLDYVYRFDPWRETLAEPPATAQNPLLSDVVLQMLPFRTLARDSLLRGEVPLWSHELGTGQPLLGNAQSAPFAPLHLLTLPLPPLRGMTVAAAWQVLLSLLLTHHLVRQLGGASAGRALAALAYALSPYQLGWLYHPLAMTTAFLPGVLLGLLRLRAEQPRAAAGLVICTLSMLLSGHPAIAAVVAATAAVLWCLLLLTAPEGRARFLRHSLVAAALTAGFSAPVLLPLAETLPASERALLARHDPQALRPPAISATILRTLVNPFALGSPRDGNWSGPGNFLEVSTGFAGVISLALALTGALVLGWRLASLMLAGTVLLLAAYGWEPLLDLIARLPLAAEISLGRLRVLWILAVAVGAGLAVERIPTSRRARVTMAALLAAALLVVHLAAPANETGWQLGWRMAATTGLVLAAIALLWPGLRGAFPAAAVASLLLELLPIGPRFQPLAPPAFDLAPPPVVAEMQRLMRTASQPQRVSAHEGRLLAYLPAIYGLWDPRGFDPMRPGVALQLLRKRLDRPALVGFFLDRDELDLGMLDFLGVRLLLTGPDRRLPEPWRPTHTSPRGVLWENPRPLGLFFIPRRLLAADDRSEALRLAETIGDLADTTAIEGVSPRRQQQGSVAVRTAGLRGFELEVKSASGGVLASSVTWMPGWRAWVNGAPAAVLRTNGAFLGVEVGTGSSRVRFHYTPPQWRLGLLLFVAASAASLLVLRRSRPRGPSRRSSAPALGTAHGGDRP